MSTNLAAKLREGTKKAHTAAENMGFIKCFLKGTVEKNSYRKLAGNLYFVYSAMEEEMERHRNHPIMGKMYFPELNRKGSLEKDLTYYYGDNWREEVSLTPGGQAYVQQIREISATEPELLIAHLYTRYMGDLSGGQILKKIAQTGMKLQDGQGTAFYEFPEIPDEKAFKANYRQTMDDLPISEATADKIVKTAIASFELNMKMFKELEGSLMKAIGIMVYHALIWGRIRGSTETKKKTEKETELATADS
ncbi:MAG: heme oxygenase (biliverdin-producing) [Hormoscilla sp.]